MENIDDLIRELKMPEYEFNNIKATLNALFVPPQRISILEIQAIASKINDSSSHQIFKFKTVLEKLDNGEVVNVNSLEFNLIFPAMPNCFSMKYESTDEKFCQYCFDNKIDFRYLGSLNYELKKHKDDRYIPTIMGL